MDPNPLTQANPQGEALKRELERKSLDKVMVYNPLDVPFSFEYDSYLHTVKPHEKKTFERFLAEKFRRDIKNYMIHKMNDDAVAERKQALQNAGVPANVVNYQANEELMNKYRTDNPELTEKIYKEVWLGVVEKYGGTGQIITPDQRAQQLSTEEQLSKELEDRVYSEPAPEPEPAPQEVKEQAVAEVSQ